ncbi:MAG: type III secretion system translocon subunit SctE [Verrucomicrobium sp.]|nr:type III secretion system translocon subunit SctE [Verrucomicrobium sp.]
MSTISSNPSMPMLTPEVILGGTSLNDIRETARESLQKALQLLGTVIAGTNTEPGGDAPALSEPKSTLMSKVTDMTLKIALLQQALDELTQQVSKSTIEGRMKEADQAHKEQIDNLEKQMKEMQEAMAKNQEANKKGGIFSAITHFFMAIVDFVSAAISILGAIANAAIGNGVGVVGLIAAAGAQICSGVCNMVMGADAVHQAIHGEGFLSDTAKEALNGVMIGCAVVAGIGGLMGGIGALTMGLKEGAKAAGKELVKAGLAEGAEQTAKAASMIAKSALSATVKQMMNPVGKQLTTEVAKELAEAASKELMKSLAKEGIEGVSKEVAEEVMKSVIMSLKKIIEPMATTALRMAVNAGIAGGAVKIAENSLNLEVLKLKAAAADALHEAELAEAAAKAMEAMITTLRKMIEDLQGQLEEMMNSAMESMNILFQCIDDSAQTMTQLHQAQAA